MKWFFAVGDRVEMVRSNGFGTVMRTYPNGTFDVKWDPPVTREQSQKYVKTVRDVIRLRPKVVV